ncbi:MAG: hypothetical protein AAGE52_19895 [Myxococcota bacterium]
MTFEELLSDWNLNPLPADPTLDEVLARVEDRQSLLDRIQRFDVSVCTKDERDLLRGRVQALAAETATLMDWADQLRKALIQEGEQARQGRRGAEGYRRVVRGGRSSLDRIA